MFAVRISSGFEIRKGAHETKQIRADSGVEGRNTRRDDDPPSNEGPSKRIVELADLDDFALSVAGTLLGLHGLDSVRGAGNCLARGNSQAKK